MTQRQIGQWFVRVPKGKIGDADNLLRKWAVAHAGTREGQARRKIKRGSNDGWSHDGTEISIRTLSNGLIPHLQVLQTVVTASERHNRPAYAAHAISWQTPMMGGGAAVLCSVNDGDARAERPWRNDAGSDALREVLDEIGGMDGYKRPNGDTVTILGRAVTEPATFARLGNLIMVLPWGDDDAPDETMQSLTAEFGDRMHQVALDHAAVRILGRQVEDPAELARLSRATMGLYMREPHEDLGRVIYLTDSPAEARTKIEQAHTQMQIEGVQDGTQELCAMLVGLAAMAGNAEVRMSVPIETADGVGGEGSEAAKELQEEAETLRLELAIAQEESARLKEERDQAYEMLGTEPPEEETEPESETRDRRAQIDGWIGEGRFGAVHFFGAATRPLSKLKQARPSAEEIGEALDQINNLSLAWGNTPSRSIGPWRNYFQSLTGWHYAPSDSEHTRTRHNADRQFKDEETGDMVAVYRHLTYHSHGASFQIYFDVDAEQRIFVAYLGNHLPYATEV